MAVRFNPEKASFSQPDELEFVWVTLLDAICARQISTGSGSLKSDAVRFTASAGDVLPQLARH
jgi:hypothetical protein